MKRNTISNNLRQLLEELFGDLCNMAIGAKCPKNISWWIDSFVEVTDGGRRESILLQLIRL